MRVKSGGAPDLLCWISISNGDVDGAGGWFAEEWIGEGHDVGFRVGEGGAEVFEECFVGRVVRPEGEDATGMEMGGEVCESFGLIERGVLFGEEVAWGVIDV